MVLKNKKLKLLLLIGIVGFFATHSLYSVKAKNFTRTQSWSNTHGKNKTVITLKYGGPNHLTPIEATVTKNGKLIHTFKKAKDFSKKNRKDYPVLYEKFSGFKKLAGKVKKALALLKKYDPFGYSIYSKIKDKSSFDGYIQSGNEFINGKIPPLETMDTAVHEISHQLDMENFRSQGNSYYTIKGTFLQVTKISKLPKRSVVYELLSKEDKEDWDLKGKADTYLANVSGTMPFEMLLEELNAYTIGANTVLQLTEGKKSPYEIGTVNPGIIHMMRFTSLYLDNLKAKKLGLYKKMKRNKAYTTVILKLWRQAEKVVNRTCASKKAMFNTPEMDKETLKRTYSDKSINGLKSLFKQETFEVPQKCN